MRRRIGMALMAGVALSMTPAQAQEAAAPKASVQQLFDTATQAMSSGDAKGALVALDELEARVGKSPRSLAIVRTRKGMALAATDRRDEARSYLEKGFAALPAEDASLQEDRFVAAEKLGAIAMSDLDYPAAVRYFGIAAAIGKAPLDRLRALLGRAQALTFIDPVAALADVEQAERIAPELTLPKDQAAQIAQVKGRVLLNLGRFAEAETVLAQAVKGQGGLSLKVDYNDLVARSDASIAAMLADHKGKARDYLVYTGAGRMAAQDFTSGADMPLPPCGEDGIGPEDRAVVEFGIGDDGAILYARPVYGSRPGTLALTFARAVREWVWRAEDVRKIPILFRFVTRLELRCSTEGGGPSIARPAIAALNQWIDGLEGKDVPDDAGLDRAAMVARFDALQAKGSDGAKEQLWLALSILAGPAVTRADLDRFGPFVVAQADRGAPPPLARLMIDTILFNAERRTAKGEPKRFVLTEARYAGDPTARAIYRLTRYDALRPGAKPRNAPLLDQVIDDKALEADSPLRVAALVRRANLRAGAGDFTGAQADFATTGLNAAQCSIVDARPAMRSASTSSDYPTDMVEVGIEGWTRVQFDVGADGRTINQRAVVTYPPMVFSRNGERILSRARFEQSYRPDGALGCSANTSTVTFRK